MYKILSINPGSTSTKVAIYEDNKEILTQSLRHKNEELIKFNKIKDQYEYREKIILDFLEKNNYDPKFLDVIVSRGGVLPPVKSGAYEINETMINYLKNETKIDHVSNLGAMIAFKISKSLNIPSYIYDPISVDEMEPIAKISGIPEIERESLIHALNMRASAIKAAKNLGKTYKESRFIVAHLGSGITLSAHKNGKMIDVISDDEGPLSPERSGGLPGRGLLKLCFSNKYTKDDITKKMRKNGGLKAYLNTDDVIEVEKMINEGNKKAKLIYEAMVYQIAKSIGELSTVLKGEMDGIVITGGMVYSDKMMNLLEERISFLGKIILMPGENEMESLSLGVLRILKGEEKAKKFQI